MMRGTPLAARIRAKSVPSESGCWVWQGAADKDGYGRIKIAGRGAQRVHRIAHEVYVGPIPASLVIDHLCRNRRCCNPAHLDVVTQGTNVRRGVRDRRVKAGAAA